MDLLQTVRKTGSRGGVNFSWDEVAASSHRENYLGHSLKAPVGRWQKGRDLNWYAKADDDAGPGGSSIETGEERAAREKKEELRKIKQAEEEAIARELGLPPPQGNTSGANSTAVRKQRSIGNSALGELPPPPPLRERGRDVRDSGHSRDHSPRRRERSRRRDDVDRRERRRRRSRSREGRRGRHDDDDEHRRHQYRDRSRDRHRERSGERHRTRDEGRRHHSRERHGRSPGDRRSGGRHGHSPGDSRASVDRHDEGRHFLDKYGSRDGRDRRHDEQHGRRRGERRDGGGSTREDRERRRGRSSSPRLSR